MKFWIEVTGGDKAWIEKRNNNELLKRGLEAPLNNRYLNFFKKVEIGDIVFTYLTRQLTENKNWRSSIVGISKVKKEYFGYRGYLYIKTVEDVELPVPIRYIDMLNPKGFSIGFKNMIKAAMQKYLINLTESDFKIIININKKNKQYFKNNQHYSYLI
jgi:hypothetical protein